MDVCLSLNDIELTYNYEEAGDLTIKVAHGIVDETELSDWLHPKAKQ